MSQIDLAKAVGYESKPTPVSRHRNVIRMARILISGGVNRLHGLNGTYCCTRWGLEPRQRTSSTCMVSFDAMVE